MENDNKGAGPQRGMAGKTEFRGIWEAQRTVKRPNDAGQSRNLKTGET